MKRLCLGLATSLAMAAATPALAGPFKAEITTYHGGTVLDFADNVRGAKCTNALHFWGIIEKAYTPGHPYDVQYRFVTQAGPAPIKEFPFGVVSSSAFPAGEITVAVSGPVNSSKVIWVQLEILKPYHVLSNKFSVRWYCKAMAPAQKVPTTKWPTQ